MKPKTFELIVILVAFTLIGYSLTLVSDRITLTWKLFFTVFSAGSIILFITLLFSTTKHALFLFILLFVPFLYLPTGYILGENASFTPLEPMLLFLVFAVAAQNVLTRKKTVVHSWVYKPFLFFITSCIFSVVVSDLPLQAVVSVIRGIIGPIVLFYLIVLLCDRGEEIDKVSLFLVVSIVLGIIAGTLLIRMGKFAGKFYGVDPGGMNLSFENWALARGFRYTLFRAFEAMNVAAGGLLLLFPVILMRSLSVRKSAGESSLWFASMVVLFVALIATGTRGALIALGLEIVLFITLTRFQIGIYSNRRIILVLLIICIVTFVSWEFISGRLVSFVSGLLCDPAFMGRTQVWVASIRMFADGSLLQKVVGWGIHGFHLRIASYVGFTVSSAHCLILHTLVERGVVGLLALVSLLTLFIRVSIRGLLGSYDRDIKLLAVGSLIGLIGWLLYANTTGDMLLPVGFRKAPFSTYILFILLGIQYRAQQLSLLKRGG